MAKEKNLTAVTSVAAADFARVVTSAGASVKATFANVAKYIVETYNGSTVAGSAQSVKSALDSLNSKTVEVPIPAGGSKTITAPSYTPYMITFHGYTGATRGALVGISDTSSLLIYNWLGATPSEIAITSAGTRQMKITNNGQYQTTCFVTVYKNSITVA